VKRTFLVLAGFLVATPSMGAASVQIKTHLDVGDARLYMNIRGHDDGAPLLIWLHGGPGGAERPLFRMYNAPLERQFIVVYLDQRGTGRSFDREADSSLLTVSRHLADLDRVIEHLLGQLGARQIVLVGHSWGSALGLLYARAHPAKAAAVVGVGQFTSDIAQQKVQYGFVKAEARRRGRTNALARIESIGPPPFTVEDGLAIARFVDRYGGYWRDRPNLFLLAAKAAMRGSAMPWELPRMIKGNNVSLHAMRDELLELDLRTQVPSIDVPVIFMLGRYDKQVDSGLAAEYYEQIAAPMKRLKWFDTAHNIPFEAPDDFNTSLPALLDSVGVRLHR
jgi:proline iminopeptidase